MFRYNFTIVRMRFCSTIMSNYHLMTIHYLNIHLLDNLRAHIRPSCDAFLYRTDVYGSNLRHYSNQYMLFCQVFAACGAQAAYTMPHTFGPRRLCRRLIVVVDSSRQTCREARGSGRIRGLSKSWGIHLLTSKQT